MDGLGDLGGLGWELSLADELGAAIDEVRFMQDMQIMEQRLQGVLLPPRVIVVGPVGPVRPVRPVAPRPAPAPAPPFWPRFQAFVKEVFFRR